MSSRTSSRIVVLKGGTSAEREVSLDSGAACATALREKGYIVSEIDAGVDLAERLREANPEVVFNALHGRYGEDGCVQGLLEWLGYRYTHSGVLASALAMDKEASKRVFAAVGLPVAKSLLAPRDEVQRAHAMPPPYVVKPNNEGSSVGIYFVAQETSRPPQLSSSMSETVMVEAYVPGRELTVAVLNGTALTVTDIYADGWYDYDAKYKEGGSRHVVPADIPADIFAACLDIAERADAALGCVGLSRADFRWDEARGLAGLYLLEVNTQPGMTATSLAPEQAAHKGIDFATLCQQLVEDAPCSR
ncbi:MAG: D-alanine--D-alanine ligase [Rhodobacteraceae bacterium]|nr:D-alanine--D-alanine ligase [Paracoccaceae bacterium]